MLCSSSHKEYTRIFLWKWLFISQDRQAMISTVFQRYPSLLQPYIYFTNESYFSFFFLHIYTLIGENQTIKHLTQSLNFCFQIFVYTKADFDKFCYKCVCFQIDEYNPNPPIYLWFNDTEIFRYRVNGRYMNYKLEFKKKKIINEPNIALGEYDLF